MKYEELSNGEKKVSISKPLFYITFLKDIGRLKEKKPNHPSSKHSVLRTVKRHRACAITPNEQSV